MGLIKLQQLEAELVRTEGSSEKMEMYEKLLMECQDAMQIVREDLTAEVVYTMYTTSMYSHYEEPIYTFHFQFQHCLFKLCCLRNKTYSSLSVYHIVPSIVQYHFVQ